jgi:hypothetical protein
MFIDPTQFEIPSPFIGRKNISLLRSSRIFGATISMNISPLRGCSTIETQARVTLLQASIAP